MRPTRIDQVVPSFGGRDAIGAHVLNLRGVLRELGYASDIWCQGAFPEVRSQCRLLSDLSPRARTGAWWLYHLSSGSPVADVVRGRPEPKLFDYHNVTPGELFGRWVPSAVEEAAAGRKQLDDMVDACFFAFADSAYNEAELRDRGCARTRVVPPLFDPEVLRSHVDRETLARRREERAGGGADWLFVGRVNPAKAQHDVIKAFACYRRLFDERARLHLVGSWMGQDYPRALLRFAARLGLGAAVRVTGPVCEGELGAYYATADVFVCASEHEGFCIPVVEAMHLGVPVVAHDAAAVGETAAGGALLLDDRSPMALATAVHRVLSDDALRHRLVDAGERRAQTFSLEGGRRRWAQAIGDAVATADGTLP